MKPKLIAAGAMLLWAGMPTAAHRLDEYLQATMISVEKNYVRAQMYLTPGVAVFPAVLASPDTDADGTISGAEQQAYAQRVLRDLSLMVDGRSLSLRLLSVSFPATKEMEEGRGGIRVDWIADLPFRRPKQTLIFENHHQSRIAAYLVNCVLPRDPDIRITEQKRNYLQSLYKLDYMQADVRQELWSAWWSSASVQTCIAALLVLVPLTLIWRHRDLSRGSTPLH